MRKIRQLQQGIAGQLFSDTAATYPTTWEAISPKG